MCWSNIRSRCSIRQNNTNHCDRFNSSGQIEMVDRIDQWVMQTEWSLSNYQSSGYGHGKVTEIFVMVDNDNPIT